MAAPTEVMLTKFEKAELIAQRAMLLECGATTLLEASEQARLKYDVVRIATREMELHMLDALVTRGSVSYRLQVRANLHSV